MLLALKYTDKELEPRKTMWQQPNVGRGGASPDRLKNTHSSQRLFALVLCATQQPPPNVLPDPNDRHNTILPNLFQVFHFLTSMVKTTNPTTMPNGHINLSFFCSMNPMFLYHSFFTPQTPMLLYYFFFSPQTILSISFALNLIHSQCTTINHTIERERKGNTKGERQKRRSGREKKIQTFKL